MFKLYYQDNKTFLLEETNRPQHIPSVGAASTLNFVFCEIKLCVVFRLKENCTQWDLEFQNQDQGFSGISLPLKAYQSNFRRGKVTVVVYKNVCDLNCIKSISNLFP